MSARGLLDTIDANMRHRAMSLSARYFCVVLLCVSVARSGAEQLVLDVVPLPFKSPRLLGMSMDDDGFIWLGSTYRKLYRYDARTGTAQEINLPFDSSTSQTICIGKKVYLLGQSYPKLMIYDRAREKFSEVALPTAKPDVWYGTDAIDGKHLYLFDRGSAGVIKWDTTTDSGKSIPYPYQTPMPCAGRYVPKDKTIWCSVWELTTGQYSPLGIARLDVERDTFTGWFPFPKEDTGNKPFTDEEATLFYPFTLKGKLVPFDINEKRWCQSIAVPEYGARFGFIGLGTIYKGRWYFSISTYNGTTTGCDGKPFHFCNGLLEFDPKTSKFAFPTLEVKDAYFQVSYHLSAGGHFFATGNNIREVDGSLNNGKIGEMVVWQTREVERK